ncbi:CAP domain-containing protein [Sporosarcina obsidiansis]|uniref:CAP domain-containing protein n=1 Tax=Sporosarcina obsidiansis TaxID=2660748 RepID=UPI00129BBDDA|nr:CAP domain-containing protein [Sporosarcina obsidiansis]
MKKPLSIILLSSAILLPNHSAEASTIDTTQTSHTYKWNVLHNQNPDLFNYIWKKYSFILENLPNKPVEKPEQPNKPEEKPEQPSKPVEKPEQPNKPEEKPQQPSKPEEKPEQPNKPEEKPQQPSKPEEKPEQPSKPEEKPQQPSTPTEEPQQPTTPPTAEKPQQPATDANVSAVEQAVLDLTNAERAKAGLKPLQFDTALQKSAKQKSADMAKNNYFSHTSPTYGSPFDQMKMNGITYRAAAENIAMGQRTAQEVVTAWMNSEGHRKNILTPGFTHIGIGYDANGNYWTQQFIQK